MPLDRADEILSWGPISELDPVPLSIKMQVWRVVFMIGVKALLNDKLGPEVAFERDRERRRRDLIKPELPVPASQRDRPRVLNRLLCTHSAIVLAKEAQWPDHNTKLLGESGEMSANMPDHQKMRTLDAPGHAAIEDVANSAGDLPIVGRRSGTGIAHLGLWCR